MMNACIQKKRQVSGKHYVCNSHYLQQHNQNILKSTPFRVFFTVRSVDGSLTRGKLSVQPVQRISLVLVWGRGGVIGMSRRL